MNRHAKVPRIDTTRLPHDLHREPQSALLANTPKPPELTRDPSTPLCTRHTTFTQAPVSPVDHMVNRIEHMLQDQREWLLQVMTIDFKGHTHFEAIQGDLDKMVRENKKLVIENQSLRRYLKNFS